MHTFLRQYEEVTGKSKVKKFDFDVFLCSLLAFTLPITNFSINIANIRIEPQRVLLTLCTLRLIAQLSLPAVKGIKRQKLIWSLFFPVLLVILYALFLTAFQPEFIRSIRATPDAEIYSFITKRGYKYLSYLAFSVYLALVLTTERKIHIVIRSLATALCVVEVLGLVQSLVFLASGVDLFPINRTDFTESVYVNFMGLRFLRVNSLTNEPKALGIFLTFSFFIKLYWNQYRQAYPFKVFRLLDFYMSRSLWLSILVILLTFSSSGLISLFFGLLITILLSKHKSFYLKTDFLIYFTLATATFLLLFIFIETLPNKIDSFLQVSILRRLSEFTLDYSIESFYASVDPEDGATLYNILNYPSVLFSGFGFGAYSNISMIYFSKYYPEGFSPFSRNILVETLFSVGIPGFSLLSWFFYKINIKFIFGRYDNDKPLHLLLNNIILINVFIRSNEPIFFMGFGILTAIYLNRIYIPESNKAEFKQAT